MALLVQETLPVCPQEMRQLSLGKWGVGLSSAIHRGEENFVW